MESFRSADRIGMLHAVRSLMLKCSGIEDLLGQVAVPTLVMSARDDVMGWRPTRPRTPSEPPAACPRCETSDQAWSKGCAAIPDCRVEEVAGTGHVSPLLIDHDSIGQLITEFWEAAVPKRVAHVHLCARSSRTGSQRGGRHPILRTPNSSFGVASTSVETDRLGRRQQRPLRRISADAVLPPQSCDVAGVGAAAATYHGQSGQFRPQRVQA